MRYRNILLSFSFLAISLALGFQNCSPVRFAAPAKYQETKSSEVDLQGAVSAGHDDSQDPPCGGLSNPCSLTPLVEKAGVVTILLALGDQVDNQLVVNGGSSQLIAESAVRYASPVENPKILVVRDANNHGESAFDPQYIATVLLARYNAVFIEEPAGGLKPSDIDQFDLVWFNNPGWPMGSATTYQTLLNFKGGVVLSGDDMSRGSTFSTTELTGLTYVDNGTSAVCGGVSYQLDDNIGRQYAVTIDASKITGVANAELTFKYGNDIDLTRVAPSVEVIATALPGGDGCTETRPVIVRYEK